MSKSMIMAAVTAVAAVMAVGAAEAKGGHGGHHHHRHFFYSAPIYVAPVYSYSGCGWAYERWMATSSYYWKRRYYACKGWW